MEAVLARIELPTLAEMSSEERLAYDEAAAGRRGHAPAPMTAWLKNPEFARRAQKLGEVVRFEISLPPRLRELAVLVVARYWSAHYEWHIHKKEALKHGIGADVVKMITSRRRPAFASEAERVVYDITVSLLETRLVPDALYREGVHALGERWIVELVGVIGYYTFVSMTLATFEIGLPEALQLELLDNNAGMAK
jgi:4-carboxymuconolactone decarboxylase